jgi:hypothetical protein
MGEMKIIYKILVGIPQGKRPLGRPGRGWRDNIRMDLREIGWEVWTGFIRLRIARCGGLLCNGNEPSGSVKGEEFLV